MLNAKLGAVGDTCDEEGTFGNMSGALQWAKFIVKAVGLCLATSIGIGAFSIWALSWDAGMFLFLLGVVLFYSAYQFLNMWILVAAAMMVRQSPSLTTAGLIVPALALLFFGLVSYSVWTWFEWSGFDGFFKRLAVTVILVRGIQGIVYGSLFTAKETD